jgi:LacI family transcriptional regulator
MSAVRQVALLVETSNAYARGLLRGVMAYVRGHEPWAFRLTEHGRGELGRRELAGWAGDGVIARIENPRVAAALRGVDRPIVDLSAARLLPALPWVETDDPAIARVAADHLIGRGLRAFGFCGDDRFNWSRWRREAFHRCLADAGFGCDDGPSAHRGRASDLAEWVRALPKPAGVLACYDVRGREVLDACRQAGVRVPDEVAVLGVDDDELLCELADPPLSSVATDPRRAGCVAAGLLAARMRGEQVEPIGHLIPPLGVTARRSTDTLAVEDADVAAAVRFIREQACGGITVHDVVSRVPLSRRVLETRFRRLIGRTPHEEIVRVRLDRARQLLHQPGWTIDAIARRTGFRHGEYLSAVFKRELGMTPGEYRAQHAHV